MREVYWDDFKVEHVKSPVVSSQDYYPFGLTFNSYQRENSVPNSLQYNSMELQDELSLGWYDYIARQYDPTLGRFLSIDLKADISRRWSPYTYGFNNPIRFVDPDGMSAEDTTRPKEYETNHNYITVSYSGGPMSSSTNTVTEVNRTTSGRVETDGDGNEIFVERSSTTTTTEVFDADGASVSQSQSVATTEKRTTIEKDMELNFSNGTESMAVKGKEISTVSTFKKTEFNPSESFKSVASVTSEYSRLHPGSSINYAAADYFQKHLGNDGADDRVKAGYAALEAISLIAASSKQLYYDKWNGSTVVDRRSDKLIKSVMKFGR